MLKAKRTETPRSTRIMTRLCAHGTTDGSAPAAERNTPPIIRLRTGMASAALWPCMQGTGPDELLWRMHRLAELVYSDDPRKSLDLCRQGLAMTQDAME